MADAQQSLITPTADALEIIKLRRNMVILLQNVGRMDFCKHRADGTPGCGVEVYWITMRGGRPAPFNEDGSRHAFKERP